MDQTNIEILAVYVIALVVFLGVYALSKARKRRAHRSLPVYEGPSALYDMGASEPAAPRAETGAVVKKTASKRKASGAKKASSKKKAPARATGTKVVSAPKTPPKKKTAAAAKR